MVLGKLPVPGRPTNLYCSRTMPTALAVGAGRSCLDIFSSSMNSFFFFLSLSGIAGNTVSKGRLAQNQKTNQPRTSSK